MIFRPFTTLLSSAGAIMMIVLAACATPEGGAGGLDKPASQVFTERGPMEVGVTTLSLSDRKIEVYYPAEAGAGKDRSFEVYKQTDPLPPVFAGMLSRIPAGVDLNVTVPAFRGAAAAKGRKFPLVLVSHGAGGWRSAHGNLLSGIASWGFVVASVDFPEYGFASFAGGSSRNGANRGAASAAAVEASLNLIDQASTAPGDLLNGLVDMSKIAAVGHSAGGGTMFAELNNPRIKAVVGWAPVPPQASQSIKKPTLIIAAEKDSAIPVASLVTAYESLGAPKRLVIVPGMGHNAFSDSCLGIQSGNDLVSAVKQMGLPVPPFLLSLAQNGCGAGDLDTRKGWAIIQHLTVAHLKSSLGGPSAPARIVTNLGPKFSDVSLDLREAL